MAKISKSNSMIVSVNMMGIQVVNKLNFSFHRKSICKYAVNQLRVSIRLTDVKISTIVLWCGCFQVPNHPIEGEVFKNKFYLLCKTTLMPPILSC